MTERRKMQSKRQAPLQHYLGTAVGRSQYTKTERASELEQTRN